MLLSVTAAHILDTPESRAAMAHQLQRSGQAVAYLGGDVVRDRRIAFGPDGRALLTSDDTGTRSWDLTTHRDGLLTDARLSELSMSRRQGIARLPGATYSADGAELVELVDLASGARTALPDARGPGVFSPDERLLATGSGLPGAHEVDHPSVVWDVATHTRLDTLPPEAGSRPWGFSPDGRVLAIDPGYYSDVADVALWDVPGRRQLHVLTDGHERGIFSVVFSPDGRTLATGGHDARIVLWDVQSGAKLRSWETHGDVFGLAFTGDGRLLVSGDGNSEVTVWDPATGQARNRIPGHFSAVTDVVTYGDQVASVDETGQVVVSDLGGRDWLLDGRVAGPATPVSFRADGTMLAVVDPTTVSMWRTDNQALVDIKQAGVLSPDWSSLFVKGGVPSNVVTTIVTGNTARETLDIRLDALAGAADPVAVSPDGAFLVTRNADRSGTLVWDVEQRLPDDTFRETTLSAVAFSADGRLVALAGGSSIVVYDMRRRVRVAEIPDNSMFGSHGLAFSPDGARLLWTTDHSAATGLGCSGCSVVVWSLEQHAEVGRLTAPDWSPGSIAFSPDGATIASSGGDTILWSADRLVPIVELPATPGDVLFDPAGAVLAVGGASDKVELWDVSPQSWRAKLCGIAGRSLTPAEWQLYLGERPYEDVCRA